MRENGNETSKGRLTMNLHYLVPPVAQKVQLERGHAPTTPVIDLFFLVIGFI